VVTTSLIALVAGAAGNLPAGTPLTLVSPIAGIDAAFVENAFGRFWVAAYFGFFVFVGVYTHFDFERTRPLPDRVTFHG
jgi:ubiquinol-cytochrome c reductase cytochrome b subunit